MTCEAVYGGRAHPLEWRFPAISRQHFAAAPMIGGAIPLCEAGVEQSQSGEAYESIFRLCLPAVGGTQSMCVLTFHLLIC